MKFRFTPETGTHRVFTIFPLLARLIDIIFTAFAVVYLWRDPHWFFHNSSYVLFSFAFFNHACRWSGWGERDSYTRNRRQK